MKGTIIELKGGDPALLAKTLNPTAHANTAILYIDYLQQRDLIEESPKSKELGYSHEHLQHGEALKRCGFTMKSGRRDFDA